MIFARPVSALQFMTIAALLLISAASSVGASQLQTAWCSPSEAPAFFVFFDPTQDQPDVWIDDQKMHLQETKSSDNVSQMWLVNLDNATFVEIS